MEFEIGDTDYNVVGSLDNNEGSVENDQDMEVLIPMDEEAVKESLAFTTEGNNQDNIQEDAIETPVEKDMEQSYEDQLKPTMMIILNTSAWDSLPKILGFGAEWIQLQLKVILANSWIFKLNVNFADDLQKLFYDEQINMMSSISSGHCLLPHQLHVPAEQGPRRDPLHYTAAAMVRVRDSIIFNHMVKLGNCSHVPNLGIF